MVVTGGCIEPGENLDICCVHKLCAVNLHKACVDLMYKLLILLRG
jgi:hypothetical protein